MILQEHWKDYLAKVYQGKPISEIQEKECHQAFFSGAFVCMAEMQSLAALPDDEALKVVTALCSESESVLAALINPKGGN